MKGLTKLFAVAAISAIAAIPVSATPVFGTGLENGLDAATLDGDFNSDVNLDQYNPDQIWTLDAVSQGNAVMMFEFAGFASTNTLGVYAQGDSSNALELFSGAATTGWTTTLRQVGSDFIATYFDASGSFVGQTSATFNTSNFGFYLTTPSDTFYSEENLNTDMAADGTTDHMVAYQGDNIDRLDPDGDGNYGLFTNNNFVLAWEDLALNASDRDYSDMVVMVESFIPVPEPGTLAILGLGLVGFGLSRRKKA